MPEQPNIVFVFSDQQRADTLGCYGQPLDISPNLDAMAAEGVLFKHAFTCQPVCGPARACLQTGQYAAETGCWRNDIALPRTDQTLANWLSAAGYEVGYIGKWHLASTGSVPGEEDVNYRTKPVPPERRGGYKDFWVASDVLEFTSHSYDGHMFDANGNKVEFDGYRVDSHTDIVLDYLRTRDGWRPFFLFVSYIEPHHQNDHAHFEGPHGSKEKYADFVVPGDLEGTGGDWAEEYPDYLGQCNSLDHNLGRIRAELDNLGIAENTVVIYTSDHGCHFCTRNSEYKRSCHDGCTHIPMIACGPGFTGGTVVEDLVSLIDIPPTILTAAQTSLPEQVRGLPLQGIVDGTIENWPQEVFIQISESQCGRAIRTMQWKYSVSIPDIVGESDVYYEDFLYDLQTDPYERNNLVRAPQYADTRAELAEILKRRMAEAGEQVPEILPAQ